MITIGDILINLVNSPGEDLTILLPLLSKQKNILTILVNSLEGDVTTLQIQEESPPTITKKGDNLIKLHPPVSEAIILLPRTIPEARLTTPPPLASSRHWDGTTTPQSLVNSPDQDQIILQALEIKFHPDQGPREKMELPGVIKEPKGGVPLGLSMMRGVRSHVIRAFQETTMSLWKQVHLEVSLREVMDRPQSVALLEGTTDKPRLCRWCRSK